MLCAYFPQDSGAAPKLFPAFVILSSNLARAAFQASPWMGTAQLPLPLQSLSPVPPWFLQALPPLHPCAAVVEQVPDPAQLLSPFAPSLLHSFNPQQACLSALFSFSSANNRPVFIVPATRPPKTAAP